MKNKIVLKFNNEEIMDEFFGWFLDGGGEQGFMEAVEMRTNRRPQTKHWKEVYGGYEIEIGEDERLED